MSKTEHDDCDAGGDLHAEWDALARKREHEEYLRSSDTPEVLGRIPSRSDMISSVRYMYDYHEADLPEEPDYREHCLDCHCLFEPSHHADLCPACQAAEDVRIDRFMEDEYAQHFHRPDLKPGEPDLCPRCGGKEAEVVWQKHLVKEPTLMVVCVDCQYSGPGITKSQRGGRKEWQLKQEVVRLWNGLQR